VEGRAELLPCEAEHALRVLRLAKGDRLIGLDGRGGSWPLSVAAVERGRLDLSTDGPLHRDPPPGGPGSALPWIELAVPWPKSGRAEEMLDRLTQLGAAAIAPIPCERAGPRPQDLSVPRRERFERILREACKQCGRTWLPVLHARVPEVQAEILLLDPTSARGLSQWVREHEPSRERGWTAERPLRVIAGPEGGFTAQERDGFLARGATPVSLGPHTLRIETAAEAAMAILAGAWFRLPRN
jgi:16S rRNA (uracil1498-N3)-methyltransferase